MSRVINAVFEDGVFKPKEKVDIEEHKEITLIVEFEPPISKKGNLDGIIDLAAHCSDIALSTNHDRYLYEEI